MVKRGCINPNTKVNGKDNDQEGCEEILSPSKEPRVRKVLCMCKNELCNDAMKPAPQMMVFRTILYAVLLPLIIR